MGGGSARTKRGADGLHAGRGGGGGGGAAVSLICIENAEGVEGNASQDFPVRGHVHHKEDDEEKPDLMM